IEPPVDPIDPPVDPEDPSTGLPPQIDPIEPPVDPIEPPVDPEDPSTGLPPQIDPIDPEEPIDVPGECRTEDPDAGQQPAYNASQTYTGGELVSHEQKVWKAKWWTQGVAPSIGVEQWELVSDLELPWSAKAVYTGGSEVNHEGRRWQASWWTQGEVPGTASVWKDIGESTCD
ncbi:hypothetical protein JGK42_002738, partial [Aeromonas veronii]|nr:hypothetical protein [Aeromonas veronii]